MLLRASLVGTLHAMLATAGAAEHQVLVTVVTSDGKPLQNASVARSGQDEFLPPDGSQLIPAVFHVDSDRISLRVAGVGGVLAEVGVELPADESDVLIQLVYDARGHATARIIGDSSFRTLSEVSTALRNARYVAQASGSTSAGDCADLMLTQNTDDSTIEPFNSVSCSTDGVNSDNYYARSYDLAHLAPGDNWRLQCVDFGVELSETDYVVDVNVYVNSGGGLPTDGPSTCAANDWVLLGSVAQPIAANTSLAMVSADFSDQDVILPGDSTIVVELFTPDGGRFHVGTNGAGESAPTYLSASDCSFPCYESNSERGVPNVQLVQRLGLESAGPATGACCDVGTGACANDVLGSECQGAFTGNTACADLSPACAAPPNDDCMAGITAIDGDGVFDFDLTDSSADGPMFDLTCGKTRVQVIDNDVWYCWTAGCPGEVAVETCEQTTVDSKIAVYEGCGCPGKVDSMACDDDGCGDQARVTFTADQGASYLIRVGTPFEAMEGAGQFSITSASEDCLPGAGVDDCTDGATPLMGTGIFPFDNSNAATDGPQMDENCLQFGDERIDNDVWFCWTAVCTGEAVVDTCGLTNVDTKIAAYDSCICPTDDSSLACRDDSCFTQSRIEFDVVAGQEYLLRLGTFSGALGGAGEFRIDCVEEVIGACCVDSVTCLDGAMPEQCDDKGGFHMGNGTSCALVDCTSGNCGEGCGANIATTGAAAGIDAAAPEPDWTSGGLVDDFALAAGRSFTCIHSEFLTTLGDGNHSVMRARIYAAPNGLSKLGAFAEAIPVYDRAFVLGDTLTHLDTGEDAFGLDVVAFNGTGPFTSLPPGNYALHLSFPGTGATGFWATAKPNNSDCAHVWGPDTDKPLSLGCSASPEFAALSFTLCEAGDEAFGACCDDDAGDCLNAVSSFQCAGRFVADTPCALIDPACGEALGACCLLDETCQEALSLHACVGSGGVFQGIGSMCSEGLCDIPSICDNLAGDCCAENETPGCDNLTCCEAVCEFDPFCCGAQWDGICATTAADFCPQLCEPASICTVATGDCRGANGSPGCSDEACCALICAQDKFCCQTTWDETCAERAINECDFELAGGCCLLGACTLETFDNCFIMGGSFRGDGSSCTIDGDAEVFGPGDGSEIPDNDAAGFSSTIQIDESGVDFINDINILLDVDHTWVGDLCAVVEHNGVSATLLQRIGTNTGTCHFGEPVGCDKDNLSITLDSDAANNINDICAKDLTGSFQPADANALSAFAGMPLDGGWTLTISDNSSADTGILNSWSVVHSIATPVTCPPEGACCRCPMETCDITEPDECDGNDNYMGDGVACSVTTGETTEASASELQLPIPDGDPFNFVAHSLEVTSSAIIGDVNVGVTILHTWVGDLVVQVEHAGVVATVINQPGDPIDAPGSPFGCDANNYDIILNDEATAGSVEGRCSDDLRSPPSYRPNDELAIFDGLDAKGTWTIRVSDTAIGEPGTLEGWLIRVTEALDEKDICEDTCGVCGNEVLEGIEECDDGNLQTGDCCGPQCRYEFSGAVCGVGPSACSGQDTCDGAGTCLQNHLPAGTECGAEPNECSNQDSCDGFGTCVPNDLPAGTTCGDGPTECSGQDTCVDGVCAANDLPAGLPCGDAGDACMTPDTCSGGGVCVPGTPITECVDDDGCCPAACASATDADCAQSVPAVSRWGILVLALLLAAAVKVGSVAPRT